MFAFIVAPENLPFSVALLAMVMIGAVAAALRYRAQAPIVDGLMKELGFDGATPESLVKGAANGAAAPSPAAPELGLTVAQEPAE